MQGAVKTAFTISSEMVIISLRHLACYSLSGEEFEGRSN